MLGWVGKTLGKMGDEFVYDILKTTAKEILTAISGKAKEEISSALGISKDTEGAKKVADDNILFEDVVQGMRRSDRKDLAEKLRAFLLELRADRTEGRKDYAVAFILWIAKGVDNHSYTKKPRFDKNRQQKKGGEENKPEEDYSYRDITEGVKWGIGFIEELLEQDSYEKRVRFLANAGVFELIKKPKTEIIKPVVEGAKVVVGFIKTNQASNLDNLAQQARSFREKAAAFRASRGR